MQCPKCHEPSPGGVSFCRRCGTALADPGPEGVARPSEAARPGSGQFEGSGRRAAAPPIIIGREAGVDLQINSPRISSRHASLSPQPDGRYLLQDLGSVNGVFVGRPDHRVKSALVGPDELVYFADRGFRVADLVGSLGAGGGREGPARLRIGREADNDIVIKDDSVSRHHAVLEREAGSTWWLEDLGSHNGTRVGGRPVTRQTVSAADSLAFGRYETRAGDLMAKAAPVRAGSPPPARPLGTRRAGPGRPQPALLAGALLAGLVLLAAVVLYAQFRSDGPGTAEAWLGGGSGDRAAHDLAEQATVYVIVSKPGGRISGGTGFFIAEGLVLTNRHVAGDRGGRAFIVNKNLGRPLEARVVANGLARRDYAVLAVEPVSSVTPLKFNLKAQRGDRVAAWGYPGLVIEGDPQLARLQAGVLSAAPEVVFTSGEISAIHQTDPPMIIHSAALSHGNSGGPLVNERGEVLGINTLIKIDDRSNRQLSNALSASDMVNFLKINDIPHLVAE